MQLREIYNSMTSDYLFEVISDKYDAFILVGMYIYVPFFLVKHRTIEMFHENL